MRILCLSLIDKITDARAVRDFKENLSKSKGSETFFNEFENILAKSGFLARSIQIVDVSINKSTNKTNW